MVPESRLAYRPASFLAPCVTLLLVAEALVSSVSCLSMVMRIQLLEAARYGGFLDPGRAQTYDNRQWLLAIIELSVSLSGFVLFLAWVYRVNRNARALGADWMRYSAGWSVGCFFVPFINLVMPYLALREIWRASRPGPKGQPQALPSPLLIVWWEAEIINAVIQYSPLRFLSDQGRLRFFTDYPWSEAGRVSEFARNSLNWELDWSWGVLIKEIMWVACSVLSAILVVSINEMQERKHEVLMATQQPHEPS